MSDPARIQIASCAAVAGAILVVGIGALRGEGDPEASGARAEWRPGPAVTGAGPAEAAGPVSGSSPRQRHDGAGIEISDRGGSALVIHVAGEVRRPGLYRLPVGARVGAAVRHAGGPTARAALDRINLAARAVDGQQVVIPTHSPSSEIGASAASAIEGNVPGPISLGSATAADLEQIDGIGPVTSGKILEFRDSRGGLGSIEELAEVHGIGPATIDRLRDSLVP